VRALGKPSGFIALPIVRPNIRSRFSPVDQSITTNFDFIICRE